MFGKKLAYAKADVIADNVPVTAFFVGRTINGIRTYVKQGGSSVVDPAALEECSLSEIKSALKSAYSNKDWTRDRSWRILYRVPISTLKFNMSMGGDTDALPIMPVLQSP